ncbi:hypothetical protein Mal4_45490 [Maioricimonas rarisocia]|uniref:Zinc-finger domain-containing protein n=1 Tax=Maioricimonas rarisocia TaxID=2528026 RepID=A0A517ZCG9_9PLAN|nr:DUF3379 domain-containing protein [Maioricimonas rarisocia]QDU40194.1 hypothetical protein Mal4_45490 [Maioricimonas rarisocia]
MNCHKALEQLDACPPELAETGDPAMQAAQLHVESCADCRELLRARRAFDVRVATAMEDVPVPDGLKDRLLQSLAEDAGGPDGQPKPVPAAAGRVDRRTFARRLIGGAVLLLMGALGLGWYVSTREVPLTLADARSRLNMLLTDAEQPLAFDALEAFDGRFDAALPEGAWNDLVVGGPRGVNINGRGGHDAAVYAIDKPGRRGVRGWLFVFAPRRIVDGPDDSVPVEANAQYLPFPNVAWTEGNRVVVCYLEQGDVSTLRARMLGTPA